MPRTAGAARLFLLLAALLFSTGGAVIKLGTLTTWQIASYRAGIAAVFLSIALPGARRRWHPSEAAAGGVYAAMVISFVAANKLTSAAHAILLQSTYPFYLALLGPFLLNEPVRRADILVLAGVGAGAVLLLLGSGPPVATAPEPFLGNAVALASGFAWALTIAMLRWLAKRDRRAESAASVAIAGNAIACAACLPAALAGPAITREGVAIVGWLGLFQVGLGYLFLTRGIRHVPAADAATLLLLEPVLNPIWAWLVHGEAPTPLALGGGMLILFVALAGAWLQARQDRESPQPEPPPEEA